MARKKRKPDGDSPPELPDRRAIEKTMQEMARSQQGGIPANTPLGRAQDLMYTAFEEPDRRRRAALAHEALALSPDCADALVLLAEQAPTRKEALQLFEQAVAAGERAIGPTAFEATVGKFWGVLETRPYMRARLGLADALWSAGRRDEAVGHLREMLRLNPNDNQGVRYILVERLLFLDRDDELAQLLASYEHDSSATWAFARALLAFRQHGDTLDSRRALKDAKKTNKHVLPYLIGRKHPPEEPPGYYSPGDDREAQIYAGGFLAAWKSTLGAVPWLRANEGKPKRKKAASPSARGPNEVVKKTLRDRAPASGNVWQAELRQPDFWVRTGDEPVRPWMSLMTCRDDDLVLAHLILEEAPSAALLWDTLAQAMLHPAAGDPHRPAELQVRADPRWEELREPLQEIGVTLTTVEALDHAGPMFEEMVEHLGGGTSPGLLEIPDAGPERIGRFYEAAASFYAQAPWKKVGFETPLQIECDRFPGGPWYAIVMGQSGLTSGLALYADLRLLRRLLTGTLSDEQAARETESLALTYGEEWNAPTADVEAARRFGWKVARPDAFPEVIRQEREINCRLPTAEELDRVEAYARAVPDFIARRKQDDPTKEEITVPLGEEKVKLVLSWVQEE